jgi:hypothetical protein
MTTSDRPRKFTAFGNGRRLAVGSLPEVIGSTKTLIDDGIESDALIFDDATGEQIDIDLRGSLDRILAHLPGTAPAIPSKVGRPKLGVVAKEVTLLPRHWEWLAAQPGGASTTLRKLVEAAKRNEHPADHGKRAQEFCYRFMVAVAGNFPGFEDASRALFTGDPAVFSAAIEKWPTDVREYAIKLASPGPDQNP